MIYYIHNAFNILQVQFICQFLKLKYEIYTFIQLILKE